MTKIEALAIGMAKFKAHQCFHNYTLLIDSFLESGEALIEAASILCNYSADLEVAAALNKPATFDVKDYHDNDD